MRIHRSSIAVLLFVSSTACYSYTEGSFASVSPGSQVRVEVTRETAERLEAALASDRRSVEGHVRSQEGGGVVLEVATASRQVGFRFEQLSQVIYLGPADATFVQLKRLDRNRTAAVVAATGVVVGALAWKAITGWTGGDTQQPGPPGPADARGSLPLFRIPMQ